MSTFIEKMQEEARTILFTHQKKDVSVFSQLDDLISQVVQNTRQDWLRSEIEKLEGEKGEIHKVDGEAWGYELLEKIGSCCPGDDATNVYEHALTTIITRYKEELLELDRKVV